MVRFKEFGGLALLATSLWLLSGVRPYELWFPILIALMGLATGLWIIGRMIRLGDSFNRRYALRALATGVVVAVGFLAYSAAPDGGLDAVAGAEELEEDGWEPFDEDRLNELRAAGRTVLVEFTSATCVNCRVNERVALDTDTAHAAYEQLDVVPMKAWIDRSEAADRWHAKLNGFGVPHMAIFPAGRPNDPETYGGLLTQKSLLDALERAAGRPYRPVSEGEPVRTAGR
jgi:thiol:disulfide interchange protein DsbD